MDGKGPTLTIVSLVNNGHGPKSGRDDPVDHHLAGPMHSLDHSFVCAVNHGNHWNLQEAGYSRCGPE